MESKNKPSGLLLAIKTSIVSFMTFLSRILGLVRDIVFAQVFGACIWRSRGRRFAIVVSVAIPGAGQDAGAAPLGAETRGRSSRIQTHGTGNFP